ncbi:unnamed protein product [Durusdinium trenchii]|uniref:Uncharacterized protein n=1 Tax=Durusdinium trenchii TaxID=1381693 RepID=A0ABP0S6L9_9DINO
MAMRGHSDDSQSSVFQSGARYKQMMSQSTLPCTLEWMENSFGLVQSESMDLQNDPRFFQANVLNKRLAAFSKLGVVSSLMVATCTHVVSMKKQLNFVTVEGWLRCLSFALMSTVLFLNIIAVYVGIAQTYHTYRLETAGPTGFEIATSYYLNANIVAWRHFAVKCLLNGLTIFLISTGIRVSVSFEELSEEEIPKISPHAAHLMGVIVLSCFVVGGLIMHYIHLKHQAVFRANYELAKESERPYMEVVHNISKRSKMGNSPITPDV